MGELWDIGIASLLGLIVLVGIFVMVGNHFQKTGLFFGARYGPYGQSPPDEYLIKHEIPYERVYKPIYFPHGTTYACCNTAIIARYTNKCPTDPKIFEEACTENDRETIRITSCYQGEIVCPNP